jgi:hypothetical protein
MSRYVVILLSLAVLTFVSCQRTEPKTLAERLLDKMIQRCKVMVPKDEHARCENPPGNTVRDAMNALHDMMVSQVRALSKDGTCSKHGWYLICTQETLSGTKNVIYRLSSADDGSDSQILSVWSEKS